VLGTNVVVAHALCFLVSQAENATRPLGKTFHSRQGIPPLYLHTLDPGKSQPDADHGFMLTTNRERERRQLFEIRFSSPNDPDTKTLNLILPEFIEKSSRPYRGYRVSPPRLPQGLQQDLPYYSTPVRKFKGCRVSNLLEISYLLWLFIANEANARYARCE
jgi:hypothetical protein